MQYTNVAFKELCTAKEELACPPKEAKVELEQALSATQKELTVLKQYSRNNHLEI